MFLKCDNGFVIANKAHWWQIALSWTEECELRKRAVKYTLRYFRVVRAKMVFLVAQGLASDEIARAWARAFKTA